MSTVTIDERPAETTGVRYLLPGEPGFEQAATAWNPLGSHAPAVIAVAEHAEHVVQAVRRARAEGLGVGVMATGHGTGHPVRGGMLINTAAMRGLSVDPLTATARVEAGVTWAELNGRAAQHGLFGLQGSTSLVGVVGYSLGGGFGWLGRHYGFASQSIVAADLVTAEGELITVSADCHPDLFWGLRGSAGNLGVVTAVELRLAQLDVVYGGSLLYPMPDAGRVLTEYAAWTREQPDAMASSAVLANFPPLPALPEAIRGQSFAGVRVCYSGADLGPGVAAVRDLHRRLGEPQLDLVRRMPAIEIDQISAEPKDPVPVLLHGDLLADLTPAGVDALLGSGVAAPPLFFVEFRHLGGALRVPADQLSPLNRTGARFSVNGVALAADPDMRRAAQAALATLAGVLAPFSDGSAYVNFLDGPDEAGRIKSAFSGSEWQRLTALKARWDPTNLFRFNRNIPPRAGLMSPA